MSSFTTPAVFELLEGRELRLKLAEPFTYHVGAEDSGFAITVPVGFVTDLASTPRILWRIIPPFGEFSKAAILHDFAYATALNTRQWCDGLFLEAMVVLGVPKWKRLAMYCGVRSFGWAAWNEHRSKDK